MAIETGDGLASGSSTVSGAGITSLVTSGFSFGNALVLATGLGTKPTAGSASGTVTVAGVGYAANVHAGAGAVICNAVVAAVSATIASISIDDLRFRLSGGTANTDKTKSLGGRMSSAETVSVEYSPELEPFAGVFIFFADSMYGGTAAIKWSPGTGLSYRAPGTATYGTPVLPTVDGNVHLTGAYAAGMGAWVFVDDLPGTETITEFEVLPRAANLFTDVPAGASSGDAYRCIYVFNQHRYQSLGVVLYTMNDPASTGTVMIALDPAGEGNGSSTGVAETLIAEDDVPITVPFTAHTTLLTGLSLVLAPRKAQAVWIKRSHVSGVKQYAGDFAQLIFEVL